MKFSPAESYGPHAFLTTRWSVVLDAGQGQESGAAALAQLCSDYWYPLYAYARRRGRSVEDAQDVTQAFFAHVIEGQMLSKARAEHGRFRSYLLGSMQHFLANEHRHGQAEKRGGGVVPVPLDEVLAEQRYALEPADTLTPEMHFERSWAFALLERTGQRLGQDYAKAGRLRLYETLQPYLAGKAGQDGYEKAGSGLDMSASAVAVAVHRMRRRYGELLREEILNTVSAPGEVEEEIAYLFRIVSML